VEDEGGGAGGGVGGGGRVTVFVGGTDAECRDGASECVEKP
jgi:hypothetical protein